MPRRSPDAVKSPRFPSLCRAPRSRFPSPPKPGKTQSQRNAEGPAADIPASTKPRHHGAMSEARKVYIKSFGCQMNVYDSHRMADALARDYRETDAPEDADLVVLNTCHIREKAAEKIYSELGRIRQMKSAAERDGRKMLIAVAGCVAQAEGEEIIRRSPVVNLVIGP